MNEFYMKCCLVFLIILGSGSCAIAQSPDEMPTRDSTIVSSDTTASVDNPITRHDSTRHVYRMNYKVTGTFCLVASAADIYAIPKIIKNKKNLTDAEIVAINPNILSGLDRWAVDQNPENRDAFYKASDYTLPVIIASAGVLMWDTCIKKDWFRLLMMYYEMHAVTFSIYNFSFFGPAFQNKYRPIVYYTQLPVYDRNGGNERNSMYSGHTATAVASTFFMVKVYSDYHPELGNRKYWLYALATVPALAEGYLRVKALAHFPSDVLVGLSIGSACGIIMPSLHKYHNKNLSVNICATPVGPGVGLNWNINPVPKIALPHTKSITAPN